MATKASHWLVLAMELTSKRGCLRKQSLFLSVQAQYILEAGIPIQQCPGLWPAHHMLG